MPTFPAVGDAARETGVGHTLTLLDFAGRQRSTRLDVAPTATTAQLDALRDAVGNASNAALIGDYRQAFTQLANPADPDVIAFDEGYPSVGDVAVFIFGNSLGNEQALEVPAPDLPLFNASDYETVNPGAALSDAIITAALAALNASGSDYAYVRGFYSKRKTKRISARTKPGTIQEPGAGDLPPP